MSASLKRTIIGSLAALAIGVSATGMTTSAFADPLHPHPPGAGHAPAGGHGGGMHGGGGGNHWHGGGAGWGAAAVGLGILGLAAGAAAAQSDPGPGPDGCMAYRPVYDAYGNFMGRRLVNVC
jgi:hypothetical protein